MSLSLSVKTEERELLILLPSLSHKEMNDIAYTWALPRFHLFPSATHKGDSQWEFSTNCSNLSIFWLKQKMLWKPCSVKLRERKNLYCHLCQKDKTAPINMGDNGGRKIYEDVSFKKYSFKIKKGSNLEAKFTWSLRI